MTKLKKRQIERMIFKRVIYKVFNISLQSYLIYCQNDLFVLQLTYNQFITICLYQQSNSKKKSLRGQLIASKFSKNDRNKTIVDALILQTIQTKHIQYKFLQEAKSIFPSQFLTNINTILGPTSNQLQQQNLSLGNQLLQINELCLYHLAQELNDSTQKQTVRSVNKNVKGGQNHIKEKDYHILQEAIQKTEQQIRKHIGIEHQMKICLEQAEDQLDVLTHQNQQLKKENIFLKKELSFAKKKQMEVTKKLKQTQEQIQYLEQKFRNNKTNFKLITQPIATILHNTSQKSLKKPPDNLKQKNLKKTPFSKGVGSSKLGSRKTSKLGLLQNQIDVNLQNFITLTTQMKKQTTTTKTEGKQIFWNKRLKKKEMPSVNGTYDYSTIQQNNQNRSLNISPRHIKQYQKEKLIKDVYATNSKDFRKSYQPNQNEGNATKKKQRRDYSNADAYQIKRTTLASGLKADRSRSVAY